MDMGYITLEHHQEIIEGLRYIGQGRLLDILAYSDAQQREEIERLRGRVKELDSALCLSVASGDNPGLFKCACKCHPKEPVK